MSNKYPSISIGNISCLAVLIYFKVILSITDKYNIFFMRQIKCDNRNASDKRSELYSCKWAVYHNPSLYLFIVVDLAIARTGIAGRCSLEKSSVIHTEVVRDPQLHLRAYGGLVH